jgi:hypothetical protein
MSVKRRVTVPFGNWVMAGFLALQEGEFNG